MGRTPHDLLPLFILQAERTLLLNIISVTVVDKLAVKSLACASRVVLPRMALRTYIHNYEPVKVALQAEL